MSAANPCAKTRPVDNPYEVWVNGDWTWKVLKKYQTPKREAQTHTHGGFVLYHHLLHTEAMKWVMST